MNFIKFLTACCLSFSLLSATELTISSYNCGGLSDHYDYLRGVGMQKLMQERQDAEPENMSLNDKIQKLALKILFSSNTQEKLAAQQEWDQKDYQRLSEHLTAAPSDPNSPNASWNQKSEKLMTNYKIRPVQIFDEEVNQMLDDHLRDLTKNTESPTLQLLDEARTIMAKRIFAHHLKYDIICLQEADYLDSSMFPEHYEVLLSETSQSINGIAYNKERFELVENIGDILGRGFAAQLRDKETAKTILVASGHLSGCNPYRIEKDPATGTDDSAKGDMEAQTIIDLFEEKGADLMLIGMDSNVTSLHPRLHILKNAGYQLDYENHLEASCTSPHQILNTRIDWITLKSDNSKAKITNIPVSNVGLNSIQTNMSDHKPVAAKVSY
ncbi:MAG: hypothetical protein CK425_08190 [Parachlamydia sp.]|nr:MAG: hypothetical protein CK425_08190 [Parachlamydia sp.]